MVAIIIPSSLIEVICHILGNVCHVAVSIINHYLHKKCINCKTNVNICPLSVYFLYSMAILDPPLVVFLVNDITQQTNVGCIYFGQGVRNSVAEFLLRAGTRVIYPAMAVHVPGYRRGRPSFIIPRVG